MSELHGWAKAMSNSTLETAPMSNKEMSGRLSDVEYLPVGSFLWCI